MSFPLQFILAVATFFTVITFYPQPLLPNFTLSIFLTCLSALIENLCEPFYLLMLQRMDMSKRVKAEGAAIFTKSIMVYAFVLWGGEKMGLLAFSLA